MVEKQVFLMKPKRQNHFSEQRECDYGAQSCKGKRLLCESMFIPIGRQTSILKMVIREVFLMKPKYQYLKMVIREVFLMKPKHQYY